MAMTEYGKDFTAEAVSWYQDHAVARFAPKQIEWPAVLTRTQLDTQLTGVPTVTPETAKKLAEAAAAMNARRDAEMAYLPKKAHMPSWAEVQAFYEAHKAKSFDRSLAAFVTAEYDVIEKLGYANPPVDAVRIAKFLLTKHKDKFGDNPNLFDIWTKVAKEFEAQKATRKAKPVEKKVVAKPRVMTGDERRAMKKRCKAAARKVAIGTLPAASYNAWDNRMGHGSPFGPHNVLLAMAESGT